MDYLTLKALPSDEAMEVYGWLLEHIGEGSFSKSLHTFESDMKWAWHSVAQRSPDAIARNPTVLIFNDPKDATYFALCWAGICGEPLDSPIEHLL